MLGKAGIFLQVWTWVGYLFPACLLPNGVPELSYHELGSMEVDSVTEHKTRFIAHRFRYEPLDDNAGIDGQIHLSRSSRNSSTLSV